MSASERTLECYISLISLWTYIGSRALRDVVARHDLEVVYKPIDLMASMDVRCWAQATRRRWSCRRRR